MIGWATAHGMVSVRGSRRSPTVARRADIGHHSRARTGEDRLHGSCLGSGGRSRLRHWPLVTLALAALVCGLAPSPAAAAPDDAGVPRAIHRFALDAQRNVYRSGDTAYVVESSASARDRAPDVTLTGIADAFTDCSGWVSHLLSSVSPLHQSVMARHRLSRKFNHGRLDEASYAWPRAAVVWDFLRSQPAEAGTVKGGFRRITDFRRLAPGDIVAWCLGGWCDPQDLDAPPVGDTGHTFVVIEPPVPISPEANDYLGLDEDGEPTLDTVPGRRVAAVIALAVVDSSSVRHFADDRDFSAVPANAPRGAVPGGLGRGRLWIAIDAAGAPVQFRFSRSDPYFPNPAEPQKVRIAAGRATGTIALGGDLTVARYRNATSRLAGRTYGAPPVRLLGRGTVRIDARSSVHLAGRSRFRGTTVVPRGARLVVTRDAALGAAANTVRLEGRLELADGFGGSTRRVLRAEAGAVLKTPGTATWRGPLRGRRLAVVAGRKLRLERLGITVRGRETVRLP